MFSQPVELFCWGTYHLADWALLRLVGAIYLIAFTSLAVQWRGLIGGRGILPVAATYGGDPPGQRWRCFLRVPTLCWWLTSERSLAAMCYVGIALSVLVILAVVQLPALLLLWLLYLSLVRAGEVFLAFQWDALLVEMGFLAILLAPLEFWADFPAATASSPVAHWLLVWLLFRLMFSSAVVKLRSGDRSWRNLTALQYHYQTQPLPNPVTCAARSGFHHGKMVRQVILCRRLNATMTVTLLRFTSNHLTQEKELQRKWSCPRKTLLAEPFPAIRAARMWRNPPD